MYFVLDKDMIEMEIVAHLPGQSRGFPPTVPKVEIVNAILYKLKTGVHWNLLPVGALFSEKPLSWQSVYHHFRKWSVTEAWNSCWARLLERHGSELDLSSVALDGSHTPAIRGGDQIDWQGRKRRRTTNALYLTDRQGVPLAMSEPLSGNHNDLFDIEVQFEVVTETLGDANISVEGLFMNADAGFDSKEFRSVCAEKQINANICFNRRNGSTDNRDEYFDRELYDERYAVERTNAWMDSFRSLLNRFDTTTESWKGFNYLAFMVIALKKFAKKKIEKV